MQQQRNSAADSRPGHSSRRDRFCNWLYALPLTVGLVMIGYALVRQGRTATESPMRPAAPASTPAPAANPPAAQRSLREAIIGRWHRPDGGYVLNITAVADDGKLTAAYYNPQPINVAQARLQEANGVSFAYVELRDVGYLGNFYRLSYDAAADTLTGTYTQPAARQQYEITFVRIK